MGENCIDCQRGANQELCLRVVLLTYSIDLQYFLEIGLIFNQDLLDNVLTKSDLSLRFDSSHLEYTELQRSGKSSLTVRMRIRKSILGSSKVEVRGAKNSQIQSTSEVRLNSQSDVEPELGLIELTDILVPELSDSDKRVLQQLKSLENYLEGDENILANILKYSFALRYLSNNQILLYSTFLEISVPINQHLTAQVLCGGMKPLSESYQQKSVEPKSSYTGLLNRRIESSEIAAPKIGFRKLWLSGYTNNIIANDPFFSQLFLLHLLLLAFLLVLAVLKYREGESEFKFFRSLQYKLSLFFLNQILKVIEASLLTILITDYILLGEYFSAGSSWEKSSLALLVASNFLVLLLTCVQARLVNRRFLSRGEYLFYSRAISRFVFYHRYAELLGGSRTSHPARQLRKRL